MFGSNWNLAESGRFEQVIDEVADSSGVRFMVMIQLEGEEDSAEELLTRMQSATSFEARRTPVPFGTEACAEGSLPGLDYLLYWSKFMPWTDHRTFYAYCNRAEFRANGVTMILVACALN